MRWPILRTLLHKELLRLLANRGAIAPAFLLLAAAVLLSLFGDRAGAPAAALAGAVPHCYVDYWDENDPWVQHLRRHVPERLSERIIFRSQAGRRGVVSYPPGAGGLQLRPPGSHRQGAGYLVWAWYPGEDATALAVYEEWFWGESRRYFGGRVNAAAARLGLDVRVEGEAGPAWYWGDAHRQFRGEAAAALEKISPQGRAIVESEVPAIEVDRSPVESTMRMDMRSMMAMALVSFALFFVLVYLQPSLTCEERERGIMLAQALSPATPWDILAAKFLIYVPLAFALAGALGAICSPVVLRRPFFWLALGVTTMGCQGIGLTIASLARKQRSASMFAMCYMLAVALLLVVAQQGNLWALSMLAQEYHALHMLYATLSAVGDWHPRLNNWGNLAAAAFLAAAWTSLAVFLFRRRGWQ